MTAKMFIHSLLSWNQQASVCKSTKRRRLGSVNLLDHIHTTYDVLDIEDGHLIHGLELLCHRGAKGFIDSLKDRVQHTLVECF
ncbi:hypothetical protein EmuJ_000575700 [Echinococcus multilocularis]|uniref:Uncharacterized protein n=1 Tax=Echinococcus multilocularis TaxID=6211 RepID=A0A068Y1G0_ECHMU|nr:hypothetical protein EmuJ_000575700 [Echinococcus multilocularis]